MVLSCRPCCCIDGEVVVYAGIVEAHVKSSEYSGAAIGGGYQYSQGGDVTIYGGKVKAFVNEGEELSNYGAGIGGGSYGGHGGKVTIWGGEVLATLYERTLYKDGKWNTLCLPFDVDDISATPLAGATIKALSSSSYDVAANTLTINFSKSTTSLTAGTPYIVKWTTTGTDVTNPVFYDAIISEIDGGSTESSYANLVGSFSPVSFTAEDNNKLFLGADNTLYSPTKARTMGSCRAYFLLHNGLTVNSLNANNARVLLDFGDGETTGVDVRGKMSDVRGEYYDLSGRRLSGQPTQKGIYIHQGKKKVVK